MRFLLALCLFAACGDGHKAPDDSGVPGDGGVDAAPDASCFMHPQTHEEIINACTDAQKVFKDSHPPKLNADGSLPPLPQ